MRERTQDYSSANRPAAQQWTGNTRYWTVLYTEYTVLCSECTGRVMTRMCCSHLCSQRLSLMWRLRADRWSSRQHRTSSDMICLTQLFRDACQDAFRSRSHVKPAESLESRPSAKPSCSHTEHRAVRWDQPQIYHQSSQEFVENVLLTPLRGRRQRAPGSCCWSSNSSSISQLSD